MERMMIMKKKQGFFCNPSSSTPPALAIQKNSHSITKIKPKIRIIHIFAPEIIKTDVANFRELVQRLTGKPTENSCIKKPRAVRTTKSDDQTMRSSTSIVCDKKMDFQNARRSFESREKMKGSEESIWQGENSGGFFGGFSDLDGLMQELGEFPLIQLDSSHTQQGYGEALHHHLI